MGSHIPIRQLRRSSVNARPRGATPSGSCRFCRIHKHLFSVSKRSTRWTLELLADKLVELNIVERISCRTVQRALKKTNSSPI